ncbi:MAG: PAS domain S-box protein [Nitrospirae bacterium]|nr:PAS domain S-box protein [Nitrospirota bacterium]
MKTPGDKIIYRLLIPVIAIVLLVFSLLTPLHINHIVSILEDNTRYQTGNYGMSALNGINAGVDDMSARLKILIDIPIIEKALAENNVAELTKLLLPVKINQELDFTGAVSHDKNLTVSFSNKDFPVEKIMDLDIVDKGIAGVRSSSLYLLNNRFYIIGVVSSSTRDNPNIIIAGKALDIDSLKSLASGPSGIGVFLYNDKGEPLARKGEAKGLTKNITPQILERFAPEKTYIMDGLHNGIQYSNFYAPLFYNNAVTGFLEVHIPLNEARKARSDIISLTLISISAGIIMILLAGYYSSSWISKRLNNMLKAVEQISSGNLEVKLTDASNDEIGKLSSSFNNMVENLKASTEKLIKENRVRREAESGLLESEERLRSIMDTANDAVISSDSRGIIIFANKATETIFGYSLEELSGKPVSLLIPKRYRDAHDKGLERVVKTGETRIIGKTIEMSALKKDGKEIPIELSLSMWEAGNETFFAAIIRDITKRIESENLLRKSEAKFRTLFDNSPDAVIILKMFQDEPRIVDFNPVTTKMFRAGRHDIFNKSLADLSPYMQPDKNFSKDRLISLTAGARGSESQIFEWRHKRFDNTYFDAEVILTPVLLDGEHYLNAIIRDITERKQAAMQTKAERDKARNYFDIAGVILLALDSKGNVSSINRRGCEILGFNADEIIGKSWFDDFIPEGLRRETKAVFFKLMGGEVKGTGYFENYVLCRGGSNRLIAWHNSLLKDADGVITGTLSSGEDITDRKMAEESAEMQLNRLKALHAIDLAIASSFDLNVILNILLDQIVSQMKVDAASILILHEKTFMLEPAAGKGFLSGTGRRKAHRVLESPAKQAVMEKSVVSISEIRNYKGIPIDFANECEKEGFVSYVAVPLVCKGIVKGVLEIFHRKSFKPDDDWLEFIQALALQAAIAVDEVMFFNQINNSNSELIEANEGTIEAWASSLELRGEPAGHTERVADMTVRIAGAFGIKDAELLHIRHGALLHDIGKMDTPDSILFKPGKLSDEEWETVKTHTTAARDLLYRIKYLRPALGIPFYHHERWDGTGYPRKLKGKEIPLGARIFTVVDVWDILSCDRPYRNAWERDKILEYIASESGRHFDPEVVKVFLEFVHENDSISKP